MKSPHLLTIYALLTGLVAGYLILALWFPLAYIYLTYEDLYGEWGQAYLFLFAGVFSGWLAVVGKRHRWFFGVLSLACLYTVLEEISWGQRLFGFESPYVFDQYNLQQETNLHNFFTGPFHTVTKNVIEVAMVVGFVAYGVIYPVLVVRRRPIALWFEHKGIAVPPIYLWPFFLIAAPLELGLLHFNEAEVAELLIGSAVLIFAMHYWYAARSSLGARPDVAWRPATSAAFAGYLVMVLGGVLLLSVTTTQLLLREPASRARIENRVLNGADKYARRFESRRQWRKAAAFNRLVYQSDPSRIESLRRLVYAYQSLGETQRFRHYYRLLLERSMPTGAFTSDSASVNISLARSYERIGDREKSAYYLQRAYISARRAVERHPSSGEAVYDLARVQERAGRLPDASRQYRRCLALDSSSASCRAGMQRMLHRMSSAAATAAHSTK